VALLEQLVFVKICPETEFTSRMGWYATIIFA